MKLKGLNICSFDPYDEFGLPKGTRYRQHNNPFISFGSKLPITIDTTSSVTAPGNSTAATQTITMTIGSFANMVLVVMINTRWELAAAGTISTVKIGSTSFTNAVKVSKTTAGTNEEASIWYLVNPPTGSQTITITPSPVTQYNMITAATNFYNVNQSTPVPTTASNTGSGATASVAITPVNAGSWIMDSIIADTAVNTPSNTALFNTTSPSVWAGASQYKSSPTIGGSNTLSWNVTGSDDWAQVAIELMRA